MTDYQQIFDQQSVISVEAAGNIRKADINEIKAFSNPPGLVKSTLEMLIPMLDPKWKTTDWKDVKKVLQNVRLMDELKNMQYDKITLKQYKGVKKMYDNLPCNELGQFIKVSKAVAGCWSYSGAWLQCVEAQLEMKKINYEVEFNENVNQQEFSNQYVNLQGQQQQVVEVQQQEVLQSNTDMEYQDEPVQQKASDVYVQNVYGSEEQVNIVKNENNGQEQEEEQEEEDEQEQVQVTQTAESQQPMQLEVQSPQKTIAQDQNRLSPNSLAISFNKVREHSAHLEEKRRGPSPKVIRSKVGRNMKVIDKTYQRNYMDKIRSNQMAMNRSQQVLDKYHGKVSSNIIDRLQSINGGVSFNDSINSKNEYIDRIVQKSIDETIKEKEMPQAAQRVAEKEFLSPQPEVNYHQQAQSMTVSPSNAYMLSKTEVKDKQPRYVSPYKASRVRTAKAKGKSNAQGNMVYTQGSPNIFEAYLQGDAETKTPSKRVKGAFMQGTLSSTKKQQKETVVRSMASALNGNPCYSPTRYSKYTVPVVESKVKTFIQTSFSNQRKSKSGAKSRPTYGVAGTTKGQETIYDAYVQPSSTIYNAQSKYDTRIQEIVNVNVNQQSEPDLVSPPQEDQKYIDGLQQVYKQETNVGRTEDNDGIKHNFVEAQVEGNSSRNVGGAELARSMSKDYVEKLMSAGSSVVSLNNSPDSKHERRVSQYEQDNFQNQEVVFSDSGAGNMSREIVQDQSVNLRSPVQNPEVANETNSTIIKKLRMSVSKKSPMKRSKIETQEQAQARELALRTKHQQMNAESDQMALEIEKLVGHMAELRGRKNETFYNDILTKDYVEDLYDTDHTKVQKLINVKDNVVRHSKSPERVISDKRQAELAAMAGRRGSSVNLGSVIMGKMQTSIRKSMKVDVNLASRDPLKFIDQVLAHHKKDNRDLVGPGSFIQDVQEQSSDDENDE